jgi:hypothetical protein
MNKSETEVRQYGNYSKMSISRFMSTSMADCGGLALSRRADIPGQLTGQPSPARWPLHSVSESSYISLDWQAGISQLPGDREVSE